MEIEKLVTSKWGKISDFFYQCKRLHWAFFMFNSINMYLMGINKTKMYGFKHALQFNVCFLYYED